MNLGGLLGLCPLGETHGGREHQGSRASVCRSSCLVTQGRNRLEKSQIPPAAKMQMRPRPPPVAMVTEPLWGQQQPGEPGLPKAPSAGGVGAWRRGRPPAVLDAVSPQSPSFKRRLRSCPRSPRSCEPHPRGPWRPPCLAPARTPTPSPDSATDSGGRPPHPRSCLDVAVLLPTGLRHSGVRARPDEQAGADRCARCPAGTRRQWALASVLPAPGGQPSLPAVPSSVMRGRSPLVRPSAGPLGPLCWRETRVPLGGQELSRSGVRRAARGCEPRAHGKGHDVTAQSEGRGQCQGPREAAEKPPSWEPLVHAGLGLGCAQPPWRRKSGPRSLSRRPALQ